MRTLINLTVLPIALYSLYVVVTATINYLALPALVLTGLVLAYNNNIEKRLAD